MLDALINLKLRVRFEVFMHGSLGVIAWRPRAVGEQVGGYVLDDGIKHDAITAGSDQRGVGVEFGEDVVVGVVGVQANENPLVVLSDGMHLFDDVGGDAGTLDHLNPRGHRVGFNGGAVVGADVDVEADDLALRACGIERAALFDGIAVLQQREHGGAEDQRAALGDAVSGGINHAQRPEP